MAALACLLATAPASSWAAPAEGQDERLAGRVVSPLSLLPSLNLTVWYTPDYHDPNETLDDESSSTLLARAVVPFQTGPLLHYARISTPYVMTPPSGRSGLGDVDAFDLLVEITDWGGWGIGPGVIFPTATRDGVGDEVWAVGPSLGFLATPGRWQVGAFSQTFFGVAGTEEARGPWRSYVQPLVTWVVDGRWAVGASEMPLTFDWRRASLAYVPVGGRVDRVFRVGSFALRVGLEGEYNFYDARTGPAWTVRVAMGVLWLRE